MLIISVKARTTFYTILENKNTEGPFVVSRHLCNTHRLYIKHQHSFWMWKRKPRLILQSDQGKQLVEAAERIKVLQPPAMKLWSCCLSNGYFKDLYQVCKHFSIFKVTLLCQHSDKTEWRRHFAISLWLNGSNWVSSYKLSYFSFCVIDPQNHAFFLLHSRAGVSNSNELQATSGIVISLEATLVSK